MTVFPTNTELQPSSVRIWHVVKCMLKKQDKSRHTKITYNKLTEQKGILLNLWFEIHQTIKLFANTEMCLGHHTKHTKTVRFSLAPYFLIELW